MLEMSFGGLRIDDYIIASMIALQKALVLQLSRIVLVCCKKAEGPLDNPMGR